MINVAPIHINVAKTEDLLYYLNIHFDNIISTFTSKYYLNIRIQNFATNPVLKMKNQTTFPTRIFCSILDNLTST